MLILKTVIFQSSTTTVTEQENERFEKWWKSSYVDSFSGLSTPVMIEAFKEVAKTAWFAAKTYHD